MLKASYRSVILLLVVSISIAVFFKFVPQSRYALLRELSNSHIGSPIVSTILLLTLVILVVTVFVAYVKIDHLAHLRPLKNESKNVQYGLVHHFKVVALPLLKYRWKPLVFAVVLPQVILVAAIGLLTTGGIRTFAFSGEGSGSEIDPYQISTCAQLQEIENGLSDHYILTTNLFCDETSSWNNGAGFLPIGDSEGDQGDNAFTGTLDGQNNTIHDLHINNTQEFSAGLFSTTNGATIQNLSISDISIDTSENGLAAGPLVGGLIISTTISHVSTSGSINIPYSNGQLVVGGLIGYSFLSSIDSVETNVDISLDYGGDNSNDKYSGAGGITATSVNTAIQDARATGSITTTSDSNNGQIINGGLVSAMLEGTLSNSYSSSGMDVTLTNNATSPVYQGGLIGFMAGTTANNNFFKGNISSTGVDEEMPKGSLVAVTSNIFDGSSLPPTGSGNYYDALNGQNGPCIDVFIEDAKELGWPQDATNDAPPAGFCNEVNAAGNQANYFIGNKTNAPMTEWDFDSIWNSVSGQLPELRGFAQTPPTIPGPVRNLEAASTTGSSVTLSWLSPSSNGNTQITDYILQYKKTSSGTWLNFSDTVSPVTGSTITGLEIGESYDFRVAAVNAIGQSDWLTLNDITTALTPSAPILNIYNNATQDDPNLFFPKLELSEPTYGTPITDYLVQYRAEGDDAWATLDDGENTDSQLEINNELFISDPAFGSFYSAHLTGPVEYRIAAVNSYGPGEWTQPQSYTIHLGATDCETLHDILLADSPFDAFLHGNIDCSDTINWNGGAGWEPIGNFDLGRTFDGQSFTVSDIYISNTQSYDIGIFEVLEGVTIKNVTLSGSMKGSHSLSNAGAIAANSFGELVISNVHSSITVQAQNSSGGLVGAAIGDTTITGSSTSGAISGRFTGGILGAIGDDDSDITIRDSTSTGAITSSQAAGGVVGVAGTVGDGNSTINLNNVDSSSDIQAMCTTGAGGLIGGTLLETDIQNSTYAGDINCENKRGHNTFKEIQGIVTAPNGNIYVLDMDYSGDSIVQVFSPDGDYETQWSLQDAANPGGIAIDSQGHVYVSDGEHSVISIFSSTGELLDEWEIEYPGAVTIDENDFIYVGTGLSEVHKFNATGTELGVFGEYGGNLGQVQSIYDIAIANDGRIYIADGLRNAIQIFNADGTFSERIGGDGVGFNGSGNNDSEFIDPSGIAFDNNGNFYVTDYGNVRIQKFDITNAHTASWSYTEGSGLNQFSRPTAITYDPESTTLLVGDSNNHRIKEISIVDGSGIKAWGSDDPYQSTDKMIAGGIVGAQTESQIRIASSITSGSINFADQGGIGGGVLGASLKDAGVDIDRDNPGNSIDLGTTVLTSNSSINIDAPTGSCICGGILGSTSLASVTDSNASGSINVGEDANPEQRTAGIIGIIGGLVGTAIDNNDNQPSLLNIENSHATGDIKVYITRPENAVLDAGGAGGLVGGVLGWTNIDSSYATGSVTVISNKDCPTECEASTTATGGLIGFIVNTLGFQNTTVVPSTINQSYSEGDIELEGSLAGGAGSGGLAGILEGTDIRVTDSHATGDVNTSDVVYQGSTGGLVGLTLMDESITLSDVYATGNVNNTAITAINSELGFPASGGLLGVTYGEAHIEKAYTTGNILGPYAAGGIIGLAYSLELQSNNALTSTITDSYSLGNISASPMQIDDEFWFGGSAGGIVGVSVATEILNTYAAGNINSLEITNQGNLPDNAAEFMIEAARGTAGGLVGTLQVIGETNPGTISNSFNAASVATRDDIVSGSLIGRAAFSLFAEPNPDGIDMGGVMENNYYDKAKNPSLLCGSVLNFTFDGNTIADVYYTQVNITNCSPVNELGTDPEYFINNNSNPPLNSWDFQQTPVWYSQAETYPTFEAGPLAPSAPRNVTIETTKTSARVRWDPPASNGGSPITNYQLQYKSKDSEWKTFPHNAGTMRDYTVSGLKPGKKYGFRVAAINIVGKSPWAPATGTTKQTTPTNNPPVDPETPGGGTFTPSTPTNQPEEGTPIDLSGTNPGNTIEALENQEKKVEQLQSIILASGATVNLLQALPWILLLLLAAAYLYQAQTQRRNNLRYQASLKLVRTLKGSLSGFVSLTSHYLGTPATTLRSSIELMASLKEINKEQSMKLTNNSTELSLYVNELILKAQTQASETEESIKIQAASFDPGAMKKLVIIPVGIAALLLIISLAILSAFNVWDVSVTSIFVNITSLIFAAVLVFVSFKVRQSQLATRAMLEKTLAAEDSVVTNIKDFILEAEAKLGALSRELHLPGDLKPKHAKQYEEGLAGLVTVSESFEKIYAFSSTKLPYPTDTSNEIAGTLNIMRQSAGARHIALDTFVPPTVKTPLSVAEMKHITQTLVDNALKFSAEGAKVAVTIKNVGKNVIYTVRDTGVGISEEKLATLMQPFARATDFEKFNYEGMGLDLYICRILVEKYGGKLKINSQVDNGTLVTVTLPKK